MRQDLHRIRFAFPKSDRLAFLGHLEVISTIERSIRRADLPFAVSNGFARRMKVQFSSALPVGVSSRAEYFDLFLTEHLDASNVLDHLASYSPTALCPFEAHYTDQALPALEAWLNRSVWRLHVMGEGICPDALDEALGLVRQAGSITYMRGEKPRTIELGPTLVGWEFVGARDDGTCVEMLLDTRSSNLGALRPAVLLDAAFGQPPLASSRQSYVRVCRSAQWHEENGERMEPFDETFCASLT
jgi:radical SAM-linked protein